MDRAALDAALAALAKIYAESTPTQITAEAAAKLAREAEVQAALGHVFESSALMAAAAALKNAGQPAAAFRLEKLANIPTSGPCAAVWPN